MPKHWDRLTHSSSKLAGCRPVAAGGSEMDLEAELEAFMRRQAEIESGTWGVVGLRHVPLNLLHEDT